MVTMHLGYQKEGLVALEYRMSKVNVKIRHKIRRSQLHRFDSVYTDSHDIAVLHEHQHQFRRGTV